MKSPTTPTIDVVIRCRNAMPSAREMLAQTLRQTEVRARILVMDCASTDGSRQVAEALGVRIVDVDPIGHLPGFLLNHGMSLTSSEIVGFVDASCVPTGTRELRTLIEPLLEEPDVAGTYGRQMERPSPDAAALADLRRTLVGPLQLTWGRFSPMAASAIRRRVWSTLPFNALLPSSEDLDWFTRVSALHEASGGEMGGEVRYVPGARFERTHERCRRDAVASRRIA